MLEKLSPVIYLLFHDTHFAFGETIIVHALKISHKDCIIWREWPSHKDSLLETKQDYYFGLFPLAGNFTTVYSSKLMCESKPEKSKVNSNHCAVTLGRKSSQLCELFPRFPLKFQNLFENKSVFPKHVVKIVQT